MTRLLAIARAALGGWLCALAVLLLFDPSAAGEFSRTGYPAWSRWLLGGLESLGGALFVFSRTIVLGGVLLFGSLMMAVGLHLGLQRGSARLLAYAAAVVLLLSAHQLRRRGNKDTESCEQ